MDNKKHIGVLTFHGAHNYGSVLQAYALQTVINKYLNEEFEKKDYSYTIINFRKKEQKDLYRIIKKNKNIGNIIGNIYNLIHYSELKKKFDKFENFINNKLLISKKEYETIEEVKNDINKYNYLLVGSDQIWNIGAFDFDWIYYLPFENKVKKISYAASFGSSHKISDDKIKEKVSYYLNKFDHISVRESVSALAVKEIIKKDPEVLIDPTLMIEKDEWDKITSEKISGLGEYIFFYSLGPSKKDIELLNQISDKLNLPIVISNTATRNDKSLRAKRVLSAGPEDFLSLIKNAKMVCTTSFHGTVFSIIFETPFFCMNVEDDDRLVSLLNMLNLKERFINNSNVNEKCKNAYNLRFEDAKKAIKFEQQRSKQYLYKALEIGGNE
ncbi:MAG: polysaccharide pyruvyl transferase family protein [Clostridium sp.]|nr:polysaccharide pyruvyl transferase family protein [Clostridium sp.]